jgi:hypothetical protein
MTFVTYFDRSRPWWFTVVLATGTGTTPTPDGGPWAVEYTVPVSERRRLSECSRTAEGILWRIVADRAAEVFAEATALGWPEVQ